MNDANGDAPHRSSASSHIPDNRPSFRLHNIFHLHHLYPLIPNCLPQLYRFLLLIGNQFCIGRVQFQEFVDILQSGLRD